MIDVRGLTKVIENGRHRVDILRGIDLFIPRGQFVSIMGASGSGKSTLLGLIAGLDSPTTGAIRLNGVDITSLSEDQLALVRGLTVGYVFQSFQLISTLTAEENVLLPYELCGANHGDGRRRARRLLEAVGLQHRMDHYPAQLSGGEQQRVAIARAFMMKPPILLADEPTGNLDSATGRHILDLLLDLHHREGATLVLVTHDQEIARHAQRCIRLEDGRILSDEMRS